MLQAGTDETSLRPAAGLHLGTFIHLGSLNALPRVAESARPMATAIQCTLFCHKVHVVAISATLALPYILALSHPGSLVELFCTVALFCTLAVSDFGIILHPCAPWQCQGVVVLQLTLFSSP